MPSTPKGLSDEKAARVLVAFREGRTLRQFAMRAGRFDAYCKAHPEYAREALPLLEETETGLLVTIRGSKADQERQGVTIAIGRYRGRPDLSPDRQGGHGAWIETNRPISGQYHQGVCRPRWFRRQHVFRPFAAIRLPDFCGRQGRINLQDDGRVPS